MRACLNFLFACLLLLAGCKGCDEKVPPAEPPPVSAAFKFYDQVGPYGAPINSPGLRMVETDTFYLLKGGSTYDSFRVIYQATDTSADSYTWKVGDDPRTFTGRASALNFDSPGLYPVTLKVTRTSKSGKVTKDSLTRSFRILRTEYHPMLGKYIGYNISKPDSLFKFFIGHGSQNRTTWEVDTLGAWSGYSGYAMTGLQGPKYSSQSIAISTAGGFITDAIDPWPDFIGNYNLKLIFVQPSKRYDSIMVDYMKFKIPEEPGNGPGVFVQEKFIGKRYL